MLKNTWAIKFVVLLTILALLAGCNAPATPAIPTPDPLHVQATEGVIKTQAASTVIADLTLNAPTVTNTPEPTATLPPTDTPVPTNTPIPVTDTPAATATRAWPTWTPGPTSTITLTSTPTNLKCSITEASPAYDAEMIPGQDFDANWTVKNTGSDTWLASAVDVRYISGTKMHEGGDARDLAGDTATDKTVKVIIDMFAPKDPGRYSATWGLYQGGTNLCVFSVTIRVPSQ